jgi:hypothetical protein
MHQPLAAVGGFGDLSTAEDDLAQRWRSARENIRLTTLLFAQPSMGLSKEILPLIPYLHGRSGANINFYFAGYSTEKSGPSDTPVTQGGDNEEWFFDVKRYLSFRADLAKQCKWSYSGAVEIVLLNAGFLPETKQAYFDYSAMLSINLDKVKKQEYFTNIGEFFEDLINYADEQDPTDPVKGYSDTRGTKLIKKAAKAGLLKLLPEFLRPSVDSAFNFTVRDMRKDKTTADDAVRKFIDI